MRLRASAYPEVDEGAACTQSSFKAGKKSFFFVGEQGGRFKAMFKLDASMPEARRLAQECPEDFQTQAGSTGWVTARFSAEKPLPKKLWQRWLDESYALSTQGSSKKRTRKKSSQKKSARSAAASRKPKNKTAKKSSSKKRTKKRTKTKTR